MATATPLHDLLRNVLRRQDLTVGEAETAMDEIMSGRATSAQIAGLLIGLAMKGERASEIVGLARTMRSHAVRLSRRFDDCFDTCGTGGDGSRTFNVSSVAAIVLAGCGVQVAKHGNRSVSSSCGSADLFEALGVNVGATPSVVERCLAEAGIGFFFAPTFHPSMRHAGPTRRELGVRTAFNLLGPLTNPAGATRQIIGVPRPEMTDLMARALVELGSERAWVVHGAGGLDEISTAGETQVSEVRAGEVSSFVVRPEDFGVTPTEIDALRVDGLEASVAMAREVLATGNGHEGPQRDVVLMNAAAGLLVTGRVGSLSDGVEMARDAVHSGRAGAAVAIMATLSQAEHDG